jgi:hypothetical protein
MVVSAILLQVIPYCRDSYLPSTTMALLTQAKEDVDVVVVGVGARILNFFALDFKLVLKLEV